METTPSQNEYIMSKGAAIAASAWKGYIKDGRGMVYVSGDLEEEIADLVPFEFVPEFDAAKCLNPWYGCKTARMVAGYNPKKEVVICFVTHAGEDDTKVQVYKIKTEPAPPYAAVG